MSNRHKRLNRLRDNLNSKRDRIDNMIKQLDKAVHDENNERALDETVYEIEDEALKLAELGFEEYYFWYEIHRLNRKLDSMQVACRFSEQQSDTLQLMVASKDSNPESRQSGLKEIRDFTRGAKELIVIDPYLYGGETEEQSAMDYVKAFKYSTRIDQSSLKKLHVIFSSAHGQTKMLKQHINGLAHDNDCEFSAIDTNKIHDRIWIKDRNSAIVVGTSLRGLGNRLCFILDLPQHDLLELLDYLKEQNLL